MTSLRSSCMRFSININKMQNKRSPYETVAAFVTISIILFLLFQHKYWLYIGGILGLLTLLVRSAAVLLDYLWLQVSKVLNFVITRVLLSAVFFIILTPIAVIYRLAGKDSLQKKAVEGTDASYFVTIDQKFSPQDFEKTW